MGLLPEAFAAVRLSLSCAWQPTVVSAWTVPQLQEASGAQQARCAVRLNACMQAAAMATRVRKRRLCACRGWAPQGSSQAARQVGAAWHGSST